MARASPLLLTAAGIAVFALGWLLWREHQRVEQLEAQLAAVSARAERHDAPKPPDQPAVPAVAKTEIQPPVVAPAPQPAEDAKPKAPRPLTENGRKLRMQMREYDRWNALAKKADLLAALTLPPDKLGALKDLLAERNYVERDARDAAKPAGIDPNTAAAVEASKIDARIRTLLGEEDYARYTELMSVEVFREQLEGTPIPGSLLDAGVPLAPEQKTWLALQMYRAFGAELTAGASAQSSAGEVSREAFKTAVLTQASSQLTPAQIEALRNFFQKDDELTVLVKTMIRERASNPSGK